MGCDGGTIPRRNELVKVKQKPESRDQASHLIFQWRYCNMTQQPLQRPIVTCGFGKLYNKSSIIEALINKEKLPSHIKSRKDIINLNLTPNPEFQEGSVDQVDISPYICPVTGLEMSGKYRFVALWSCGCVFSERVLNEIKAESCPKCQHTFEDVDVVILNTEEEDELQKLWKKFVMRRKRKKLNCAKIRT